MTRKEKRQMRWALKRKLVRQVSALNEQLEVLRERNRWYERHFSGSSECWCEGERNGPLV